MADDPEDRINAKLRELGAALGQLAQVLGDPMFVPMSEDDMDTVTRALDIAAKHCGERAFKLAPKYRQQRLDASKHYRDLYDRLYDFWLARRASEDQT